MSSEEATSRSLVSVGRNAIYLAIAAGIAQALAIVRELFLAAQVGISGEFDALLVALGLPVMLANVFINGTATALVPAYSELRAERGVEAARALAGTILFWAALVGLLVAAMLGLAGNLVISIAGPGLSSNNHAEAVAYLQFLAPLAVITIASGVLYAVCQSEEYFRAIALANLVGPAVTLGTLVLFWSERGLWAFAVGSLLGPTVTGLILLLGAYRRSAVPRLTIRPSAQAFEVARHSAPLTVSSALLLLTAIGDKALATLLFPGAVSVLRYAEVLVRVPVGVIGPAWSSAIYPTLVRAAQGRGGGELGSTAGLALRYALVVFVPIAALAAAVAPIGVAIAYGRGAFDPAELQLTSQMVAAFSPLIVLLMTVPVLTNSLNAQRRGTTVLKGGAINAAMNLVLDVVLGLTVGVVGLAIAPGISSSIAAAFFARRLAERDASMDLARVRGTLRRVALVVVPASLLAAAFAWGAWSFDGLLPALAALSLLSLAVVYVDVRLALRAGLTEVAALVDVAIGRAPRRLRSIALTLVGRRVAVARE